MLRHPRHTYPVQLDLQYLLIELHNLWDSENIEGLDYVGGLHLYATRRSRYNDLYVCSVLVNFDNEPRGNCPSGRCGGCPQSPCYVGRDVQRPAAASVSTYLVNYVHRVHSMA